MANPFKKIAETFLTAYAQDKGEYGGGGLNKILQPLFAKLKIWLAITTIMFIIYYILLIGSCSRPSTGNGTCIQPEEQGLNNSFEIDLSTVSTGGTCSDDIYNVGGQTIDWIDTGFETTGKPLIVYASGNYFPWGKQQTAKTYGYHTIVTKLNDGTFAETLTITEDYEECGLNTILRYLGTDNQETILAYQNQLNAYTLWNSNNRLSQISGSLFNKENEHIMADCVIGGNCKAGSEKEDPTSCVLKNGAGIYMRIGNEAEFAYHIINHQIPKLKKTCITAKDCSYSYVKSGTDTVLQTIPFGLPTLVYNYEGADSKTFIHDIRDSITRDIIPVTDYTHETEYEFSILQLRNDQESSCTGLKEQLISGYCYQSVTKKLTLQEMQNPTCPPDGKTEIILPNELCAPQKGKRIWIKPADTCYEDNDGNIKLTFIGGAINKNPKFQFENHGFKLSWIQSILLKVLTPFWGDQGDTDKIEDYTTPMDRSVKNQIKICRTDATGEIVSDDLYFSKRGDNYAIKLNKLDLSGMLIKNDEIAPTKVSSIAYAESDGKLKKNCVIITLHEYITTTSSDGSITRIPVKTTTDNFYPEYANQASTLLFKYNDMEHGLFVQVRNAIMSSHVYHTFRILVVVWFVFSFGIGFVIKSKYKILSVKTLTMDWKRFLILMWVSDPNNYDFIDHLLWPGLFKMVESVASGIFDAASGIWGTSLQYDNPLDFFDNIIEGITSKELIYRLGAIATTPSIFYTFFVIFPFVVAYCIDLVCFVAGPVLCLCLSLFDLGQLVMFMPIYALVSLSDINKNSFKVAINGLINDFVHMAFSIGFFGMFCGFIYYSFTKLMYYKICWEDTFSINFFGIFKHTWGDWMMQGGFKEKIKLCWNIILNITEASILTGTIGKMLVPTLVEELANIFAKASNGNFGFAKANAMSQFAGQFLQDVVDEKYKAMQEAKKQEKEGAKGNKGELQDGNTPAKPPVNNPLQGPPPRSQQQSHGVSINRPNETNDIPQTKNDNVQPQAKMENKQEEGAKTDNPPTTPPSGLPSQPQQPPQSPAKNAKSDNEEKNEGEKNPQQPQSNPPSNDGGNKDDGKKDDGKNENPPSPPNDNQPQSEHKQDEEQMESEIVNEITIINKKIIKKKKPSKKDFILDDIQEHKKKEDTKEDTKEYGKEGKKDGFYIIKKKKPSKKDFILDAKKFLPKYNKPVIDNDIAQIVIEDVKRSGALIEGMKNAGMQDMKNAGMQDMKNAGMQDISNAGLSDAMQGSEDDDDNSQQQKQQQKKAEQKMKQAQKQLDEQLAEEKKKKKEIELANAKIKKQQKELELERMKYEQMAANIDLNELMSQVNAAQTKASLKVANELRIKKQKVLKTMHDSNLSYQQKLDAKIEILQMLAKANSGKLKIAKQNNYLSTKKKK